MSQGRETTGFDAVSGAATTNFFTRRLNLQCVLKPARIGFARPDSWLASGVGLSGAIRDNRSYAK
jgi:hypothetical protein